jgi:hypothetical protein
MDKLPNGMTKLWHWPLRRAEFRNYDFAETFLILEGNRFEFVCILTRRNYLRRLMGSATRVEDDWRATMV